MPKGQNRPVKEPSVSSLRVCLYLLGMLIPLILFYLLFMDFWLYAFFQRLVQQYVASSAYVSYPLSFVIGFIVVSVLYYNVTCPIVEDCLSLGVMNQHIIKRLEDKHSHELVHIVIFTFLLLTRAFSLWLGSYFALGIYSVLWGGAVGSLLVRVVSLKPFGSDDRKYAEAKTRFLRTGKRSPHSTSLEKPFFIALFGELVLCTLYFLFS